METFENQTDKIEKALAQFIQGGKNKSVICLVASGREYQAWVPARELPERERFQMEERLMRALIADRELFKSFLRIVEPVRRFYRREDRKASKGEK